MPCCKKCKTCPNSAGFKLCNQPYALCSKADCHIKSQKSQF